MQQKGATLEDHESWATYVKRIAPGRLQKDIAAAAGVDSSTVSRWLDKHERPKADAVVRFARAEGQDAVQALIAANYLEPEDIEGARVIEVMSSPKQISDDALLEEVRVRLAERPQGTNTTGRLTPKGD